YKDAGVDTHEGQKAVKLMKEHVSKTFSPGVLTGLGSFGGLFQPDLKGISEPVLVSGTDGVGTKLKIAFMMDKHNTVGIDCVAMCVNDILCQGATPLFFLDYLATGKVEAEKIAEIVSGIAEGCLESGAALIGGETAEMPGFYAEGEYDMAGFAVGIVDKSKIITGEKINVGDKIIALPSSGLHSNGYSLARKVLLDTETPTEIMDALLTPTKIYAKECKLLFASEKIKVKGLVHITGGGFYENIPRVLPENTGVKVDMSTLPLPKIFDLIEKEGNIDKKEMYSTFNMGVGLMVFLDKSEVDEALNLLNTAGHLAYEIGEVIDTHEKDEDKRIKIKGIDGN
ncbi:MAG: phosphoribosylformylglycinamidine cyclo-ligase, partial [Anaerovoracaceae bacterium]